MNPHLFVQISRAAELNAQATHFTRGCFFVPVPDPPPEPFSELDVTLIGPHGRLNCKANVIQIAMGAGLALACNDAAGLAPAFETWLTSALGAANDAPSASSWLDPEQAETAAADTATADAVTADAGAVDQLRADDGVPLYEKLRAMSVATKRRLALEGDRTTRQLLLKDPNKALHAAVLRNRNITSEEVRFLAGYRQANPEALNQIADHREWSKNPQIMMALVGNPKTPGPSALKLLRKLPIQDIRRLAKSPGTPRAVAVAARKIVAK